MTWFRVLRARLFALGHKTELETQMDEEVRFHLAMRARDNVQKGMSESEASAEAKRQFGNINLVKDRWRDVTGGGLLEALWHDLRFAGRMLLKDRAFAMIAVLALGLGIGANTALFTVVSRVLLRPLPYPHPEEIMFVGLQEDRRSDLSGLFSYPDFADFQTENRWFDGLGAFYTQGTVVSGGEADPIRVQGTRLTPQILEMLGVAPMLGRVFTEEENEPGNRSALVSYQLWQERFAGASALFGATIDLDGFKYNVIGVMPPGFEFPVSNDPAQVWITFGRDREPPPGTDVGITKHRDAHYLRVLGRLKPNVSRAEAAKGFSDMAASLASKYPATNRRFDSCVVVPWLAEITERVRPALFMLIGAAVCVLCVACANVANLLLARATTRQKEMAIRAAIGAGRGRILRQLLTESLLVASIGGCLGLLFALAGTHYIVSLLPPDFPRKGEIAPDTQMLVFTGIVSVITSCLFGFAPAWRSARCKLARVLNDCSRVAEDSPRGRRLRSGLVVVELVLAFVLLGGALCLIRSLWKLQGAPPGFDAEGLVTVGLALSQQNNGDPVDLSAQFYVELMGRLAAEKDIQASAAVFPLPLTSRALCDFEIAGRQIPKADLPRGRVHTVTPNYFQTMAIPLKQGRDFDGRDRRGAPPVVIVNETFVRTIFPNEDPIGKRIRPGLTDGAAPPLEREIIGVVGDVKGEDLTTHRLEAYVPHPQCVSDDMTLVLRGTGSEESTLAAVRRVVGSMERDVPVYQIHRMQHYLAAAVAQARLNSTLMAIFAAVAVTLTAIGVYGVMAYSVVQRRHEIGIRLALGAQKFSVIHLILGQGMRLLGWSLLPGGLCAAIVIRSLRLGGHGAMDNEMFAIPSVAIFLSTVALIACWLPARRAAGLDPLTALGQR
jgi:putative ABC transport system permease protein